MQHQAVQLRWADLDSYHHVNNVRYADFADEALRGLVADGSFDVAGRRVVLSAIDYLRPLAWRPEPFEMPSRVRRIGGASFVVESCVQEDGVVLSRSSIILVGFDPATQRSRRLEDHERAALTQLMG